MNTQNNVPFSQLNDYELVDKNQDIRGWPLKDDTGTTMGTVQDLLVDTKQERVTTLVLDNGKTIPATDIALGDHVVLFGTKDRAAARGGSAKAGARNEQVVPVVEEVMRVGKREVNAGGVRVDTRIVSEPVEQTVALREERVSVERRPVNRTLSTEEAAGIKGQSVEVSAQSEEAVVAKVARVVEEIVIRKDVGERTETIRDSVKHTEVNVADGTDFDAAQFKEHYDSQLSGSGYAFEDYGPAYRFGSTMRSDARFNGDAWSDVEPNARSAWEERNPGTWAHFKEAVQHAWTKVRGG